MFILKKIGLSYSYFSFFIYSIMIWCYLWYFDKNLNDEKYWYVSLLFILPYLKSMNIIRNIYAAALGLVTIQKINEKKYGMATVFAIIAYLNHYISIVLLAFILFCKYIPEKWYNSRKKSLVISVYSLLVTLISIPVLIEFLANSRYSSYINRMQFSIWGYIPYALIYTFILIFYDDFMKVIKEKNHLIFYKMIVFLSIIVPAFTALNGTYRLLLFFDIPRFIMYGDLIYILRIKIGDYIKNKTKFLKTGIKLIYKNFDFLMILGYIIWITFRIWRMYEYARIMPYFSNLFH